MRVNCEHIGILPATRNLHPGTSLFLLTSFNDSSRFLHGSDDKGSGYGEQRKLFGKSPGSRVSSQSFYAPTSGVTLGVGALLRQHPLQCRVSRTPIIMALYGHSRINLWVDGWTLFQTIIMRAEGYRTLFIF